MFRLPVARVSNLALKGAAARRMASSAGAPVITQIETRWGSMPEPEKVELSKKLSEVMKADWTKVSAEDKKAAYYIDFGPHGYRKPISKKGDGMKVLTYVAATVALSLTVSYTIRKIADPKERTMNKEWQEKSNEYALSQKSNPILGISSEGYSGKGHVQSS
ncbi:Cytochrome c oxidase polypeptide 5, mitochondrial [Zancudomyces culisetae]|uniref:Cytochrome c oxidase polypeptide 5, mitochondrial n=1 Tax=Zancudomyces culisetae TaxID=1213189 RepID=A0A1R1PQU9_ZANCU|nr:Cytochrome c oxidase polypeptide 5, mitochondrial [Zancudomyces culisetae]|eukprot:OMH83283.1 Cytochrome c oxidase polypeptide 5, mitochondrial [Zancudomyces culisetae]